jgi:hypothetical protein
LAVFVVTRSAQRPNVTRDEARRIFQGRCGTRNTYAMN